jgi:hypothetical protein
MSLVSRTGCGTTVRFSIPTEVLGIEAEAMGARVGRVRSGAGSIGPMDQWVRGIRGPLDDQDRGAGVGTTQAFSHSHERPLVCRGLLAARALD